MHTLTDDEVKRNPQSPLEDALRGESTLVTADEQAVMVAIALGAKTSTAAILLDQVQVPEEASVPHVRGYEPCINAGFKAGCRSTAAGTQYSGAEVSEHDESDGFGPMGRRQPQQYQQVLSGFATPPMGRRRAFMFRNL